MCGLILLSMVSFTRFASGPYGLVEWQSVTITEPPGGGLRLQSIREPGRPRQIRVVWAQPEACFTDELIADIIGCRWEPGRLVELDFAGHDRLEPGVVLRIRAVNQHLVYRLVEHDEQMLSWLGRWPD